MRVSPELEAKLLAQPGVTVNGRAPLAVVHPPLATTIDETDFQDLVTAFAEEQGWKWYHPTISRRSKEGFPDLTLVRGNRVIFAELKSATGERTADQLAWADVLSAVGGTVEYFLWRPADWPAIVATLRAVPALAKQPPDRLCCEESTPETPAMRQEGSQG